MSVAVRRTKPHFSSLTIPTAATLGLFVAAVAIGLRLLIPAEIGGAQTIFSFPAIAIATLLLGVSAGIVTAIICWISFWYFVVPVTHSFAIANAAGAISLVIYLVVAGALIWSIGEMRAAVTRFRRLNQSLEREVEARTAERNGLWQRSKELLAVLDLDGRMTASNPALQALLSRPMNEVCGSDFRSTLFSEDRPIFDEACRETRQGDAVAFDARVDSKEDCSWIAWSLVREDQCLYLVGRDFTVEHDLSERLSQSQKMEFIGQMAGGLAHDFGNLLPPISMTLHLLEKRHGDDPRTSRLIEAANLSVERAGKLIERLLSLSRPSRIEPRICSVQSLLNEIAPLLRQPIGGRSLFVTVDPDVADVRVDPHQLDMALLNLIMNARDATDDDGKLQLLVTQKGPETVAISVSDNGRGMDAETLRRAQEPFFSTKPSGEGSGLGLPMVHNFAVGAGGALQIESSPNVGTQVTILLPSKECGHEGGRAGIAARPALGVAHETGAK